MNAILPTLILVSCCGCRAATSVAPAGDPSLESLACLPAASPVQPRAEVASPGLAAHPKMTALRRIERALGRDRRRQDGASAVLPSYFQDSQDIDRMARAAAQNSGEDRWSLDFGTGLEEEVPTHDDVRSELESGFSDLVLSVSWTFGLSQMTALKGQVAAARVQDVNLNEVFDDAELAWLTFGVEFGF